MNPLAAAGDFLTRNVGHALNAGNNLLNYGSLHAPTQAPQGGYAPGTGPTSIGSQLVNIARADPSNPGSFIDLASPAANAPAPAVKPGTSPASGAAGPGSPAAGATGGNQASGSSTSGGAGTSTPQYAGFQDYLGKLTGAYNSLFGNGGQYDQQTASRENSDTANYNAQKDALNQQYGDTMEYMPGQYGARGLGSSSYLNNAMDSANNTYKSNAEQLGNAQQNDIVALQQAAGSAKNQGNAQLEAYRKLAEGGANSPLAQMPAYLQAEQYGNILNANTAAQGELGATGSNESFLSHIPAPVQNQGTAELQAQLQALAGSSTTGAAKNQIASGLIGNAQLPQNQQTAMQGYWNQVSNS